jgi:hypothetical protein
MKSDRARDEAATRKQYPGPEAKGTAEKKPWLTHRNLRRQQNPTGRRLSILVPPTTSNRPRGLINGAG